MTCPACGKPLESNRHHLARFCLRPVCVRQCMQARKHRQKVAA